MKLSASWRISGIVSELRQLSSEKNKTWKGYVAKLASIGATYEVQVTAEQFASLGQGQVVQAVGSFQEQMGRQRFVTTSITPLEDKAAQVSNKDGAQ